MPITRRQHGRQALGDDSISHYEENVRIFATTSSGSPQFDRAILDFGPRPPLTQAGQTSLTDRHGSGAFASTEILRLKA